MSSYKLAVAVGLLALAGCKKAGPEITLVTGRVTVDGKPLRSGRVTVTADDDIGRTSGPIIADGTYTLIGAAVGPSKFSVNTSDFKILLQEPDSGIKPGPNPDYVPIPARYDRPDTSGLAFTVPSGKAMYDIELTTK